VRALSLSPLSATHQASPQEGLAVVRVEGSAPSELIRGFLDSIEVKEDEPTFPL
jgi:hypothetical protein